MKFYCLKRHVKFMILKQVFLWTGFLILVAIPKKKKKKGTTYERSICTIKKETFNVKTKKFHEVIENKIYLQTLTFEKDKY